MGLMTLPQDLVTRVKGFVEVHVALARQSYNEAMANTRIVSNTREQISVQQAVRLLRRADRMEMVDGINVEIYRGAVGMPFDSQESEGTANDFSGEEAIHLLHQHYFLGNGYHRATRTETGRENHHIKFVYGKLSDKLPTDSEFDGGLSYVVIGGSRYARIHGIIRMNYGLHNDIANQIKT